MSGRIAKLARLGRRAATVVAILAVMFVLTAFLAIVLETPRTILLRVAVDRIAANLQPDLRVERIRWPATGSIELAGITLVENADTLLAADTAVVSVRLASLFRRDLDVETIAVSGLALDLPRLQEAFPSAPARDSTDAPEGAAFFPLRPGAIEGFPSARIGSLRLSGETLDLGGAKIVNFRLGAGGDNRAGQNPAIALLELHAEDASGIWRLEQAEASAKAGDAFVLDAVVGIAPDNLIRIDVREKSAGEYGIRVQEAGAKGAAAKPILEGNVYGEFGNREAPIRFDLAGAVPGTARLRRYSPLAPSLDGVPDLDALPISIDGYWSLGESAGAFDFVAGPNDWVRQAKARVSSDPHRARVDSLVLSLDGIEARGSFGVGDGRAEGSGRVEIAHLRGLAPLLGSPADSMPSVAGVLTFDSSGPIDSLATNATIRLTEVGPAPAIRNLDIDARHARPGGSIDLQLDVRTDFARADLAARTDESFTRVAVGPIRVLETVPNADPRPRDPSAPATGNAPGEIRIDRKAGAIAFSSLRVTGDFGNLSVGGSASSEGASVK
ncbi:MAG: hypothetical protein HKN20_13585, partial [Gemmatimonadetes bacterium]|nr:hypothetical protein [Gemmatimonadota bacterium]